VGGHPSAGHPTGDRPTRVPAGPVIQRPAVVKGVIFDVDGTLLDSNGTHADAWVRALAEGGHSVRYDQVRPLIGMGGDKVLPILTGIEGHGPSADLINTRRKRYFLDNLPLLSPQPGARHLVQMIRDHGLATSVASSATAEELHQLLTAADVADLVGDVIVSKDDAAASKPDPDIVGAALQRLGLSPAEVVMIGDTPYDIEAAQAIGIGTIALRCGGWSSQELSNAIAIYDSPQDLADDYEASPLAGRG
jgi:HAD superfamily hydrolase (TIGR01509 family)